MTKVIEKRLSGLFGEANLDKKVILIDPRQRPKSYMDTLIHESLHIAFPKLSETGVRKASKVIRDILWEQGYRKVTL